MLLLHFFFIILHIGDRHMFHLGLNTGKVKKYKIHRSEEYYGKTAAV